MPRSSKYKKLFHNPTLEDKLTLFRTLLDASDELTVNLALALLNAIHQELSTDQTRDRLMYKRYAEEIAALRFYMPGILQQVVSAWNTRPNALGSAAGGTNAPVEWFSPRPQR